MKYYAYIVWRTENIYANTVTQKIRDQEDKFREDESWFQVER